MANPKNGEYKINRGFKNNSLSKINMFDKNNTHIGSLTDVVVCDNQMNNKIRLDNLKKKINKAEQKNLYENISLDLLREEAENIIGEKLWRNQFESAMRNVTIEKFKEHLSNWDMHKLNAKKTGAYFIQVLTNDIKPVKPEKQVYNQNRIPQRDNFDQKEYTDEELEKYYANLTE